MHAWAAVCHLLQSSKSPLTGFLCSIGWRTIDQTRLSSNTPRTSTVSLIQQSSVRNNYISLLSDLCACVHVKKNGGLKEAIVLQWAVRIARVTSNLGESDGLVHCSVKNAAVLVPSRCFLVPLGVLFSMKTLDDEWYVVIQAYKLTVFEILRIFFVLSYKWQPHSW